MVVEVNGAPASYREAGSGPVALLTPGLGLTSRFYEDSYAAFSGAGIRLVVPDPPGWGATRGPLTGVSAGQVARFLVAFADAIGVHEAVWLGHSLSVHPVVQIATDWPARARGVVLAGPTGDPRRFVLVRQVLGLTKEGMRTTGSVRRAVAREYVTVSPLRYVGTWLRHSRDDLVGRARRVHCPALLLAGDADPVCRPAFLELLRQRMPHARVELVPGATHALPRGHVSAFNCAVLRFMNGLR